jgi:hypothetical protein
MASITTSFDRTTHRLCISCRLIHPHADFESNKGPRRQPLGELDPNAGSNTTQSNPCKTCTRCREKTKNLMAANRQHKKRKLFEENWPTCSWQELSRQMEEGYRSPASTALTYSFLESDTKVSYRFLVTGFYEAQGPQPMSKPTDSSEFTKIARFLADTIGEAQGISFNTQKKRQFKGERGVPSSLAQCTSISFECQQIDRHFPSDGTLSHKKTRKRRRKLKRFPCGGRFIVYFPNLESNTTTFDLAIDYEHIIHEGAKHFGVPKRVREWIRNNPQPSPLLQREALLSSIRNNELPGYQDRYFRVQDITYWWRKGVAEVLYISKDPFENITHFLQNHPKVCTSLIGWTTNILGQQSCGQRS